MWAKPSCVHINFAVAIKNTLGLLKNANGSELSKQQLKHQFSSIYPKQS